MDQAAANFLTKAALEKSSEIGVNMNIAVCDAGGHLVTFVKMDNAWLGSIDIAIKKAKTSSLFGGLSTMQLGDIVRQNNLQGIEQTTNGLATFGGGIGIKSGGIVIGSIGVSGGSPQEDHDVAEAAVKAFAQYGHNGK